MYDLSEAVVRWDGPENVCYAVLRADGMVLDWPDMTWVARGEEPTLEQLRGMSHYTFGPHEWSQDVIPRLDPIPCPAVVIYYVVDDAGVPISSPGSYMLDVFEEETPFRRR